MKFKTYTVQSDLVIVGAGMPGICAAIEAARNGLAVSLINNRGCLGGNAGCENRIHICGADGTSEFNNHARESGIIEELRLENLHRNPQGNVYLWSTVLVDFIKSEPNIELFLNTNIDNVCVEDSTIIAVEGSQIGSEKHFWFRGELFVDDTGDGTIGYLGGATWMYGREAKNTYNEKIAPEKADEEVLLSCLPFYSKEFPDKVSFKLPEFAKKIKPKIDEALNFREIPERMPGDFRYDGYRFQWYYESGGDLNQISDNEKIIEEQKKLAYGIWNEIKNSGKYNSAKFDIEYISLFPSKRESRRLVGEYIMTENDIKTQTDFSDVIAHGGWSIDLHAGKGFYSKELINRHYFLNGIYQIPYRATVVKNVNNLFVASRCLSASHVASGTLRLMGTLSAIGQAVGAAAVLCLRYNLTPKELYNDKMIELQQLLLRDDQTLIGVSNKDTMDFVKNAKITASSNATCENVVQENFHTLDKTVGFIVPVRNKLDTVSFCIKTKKNTELKFTIYSSAKKENYNPANKLKEITVGVTSSRTFEWIEIPVNCNEKNGKLFFKIHKNLLIDMAFSSDILNGVYFYTQNVNTENNFCSIETLGVKKYIWKKQAELPLFKLSNNEEIYSAQNINNGFNKNYGLPNLWISSKKDSKPLLTIDFTKEVTISKIQLIFDSNLNFSYDNLETKHAYNVFPQIVKSYIIYIMESGVRKNIAQINDNYQRINKISFDSITTNKLYIEITATNGNSRVGIYEIRAYK